VLLHLSTRWLPPATPLTPSWGIEFPPPTSLHVAVSLPYMSSLSFSIILASPATALPCACVPQGPPAPALFPASLPPSSPPCSTPKSAPPSPPQRLGFRRRAIQTAPQNPSSPHTYSRETFLCHPGKAGGSFLHQTARSRTEEGLEFSASLLRSKGRLRNVLPAFL